jgi:hypothetical protein
MQTLLFNTTTKYVKVYENSTIIHEFYNISTVKPREGYYELIEKKRRDEDVETSKPVARFPISNTNMLIED